MVHRHYKHVIIYACATKVKTDGVVLHIHSVGKVKHPTLSRVFIKTWNYSGGWYGIYKLKWSILADSFV